MSDDGELLRKILQDSNYWRTRILLTAVRLEIFTLLATRPRSAEDIAGEIKADAPSCQRLLAALEEMGYVRSNRDLYENTEPSQRYLVRGGAQYLGWWHLLEDHEWSTWGDLTARIKTGQISSRKRDAFEDKSWHQMLLRAAHDRALILRHVDNVLKYVDLGSARTLVDIGGGAGTYAMGFCRSYPELRATIFDLPAAIEVAVNAVAAARMGDRVRFAVGDFHVDDLGGPYDVAFLSNVAHGETESGVIELLSKIRQALVPGGMVLIRDHFLEYNRTSDLGGAVFGVMLMIETKGGRTYKASEFRLALKKARFASFKRLAPNLIAAWSPENARDHQSQNSNPRRESIWSVRPNSGAR